MGSLVRRLLNPIPRCRDQLRNRYAWTDDGRGTGQELDADRLTLMTVRSERTHLPAEATLIWSGVALPTCRGAGNYCLSGTSTWFQRIAELASATHRESHADLRLRGMEP